MSSAYDSDDERRSTTTTPTPARVRAIANCAANRAPREQTLETLRLERSADGHVLEVVLNRPARLNAMNNAFFEEIGDVFLRAVPADQLVRCVIVRGAGRMFSAGLDLKEQATQSESALSPGAGAERCAAEQAAAFLDFVKTWQAAFAALHTCKQPVIAAVHGRCIGGGVDLVTSADIRLASADADFSIQETRLGMVADVGTLARINKIVGTGVVREMTFTGAPMSAARALHCGLVNRVYDTHDTLLAGAREMARAIADNSPLAVAGAKRVINFTDAHPDPRDSLDYVAVWNAAFLKSDDLMTAITAFMTKSKPEFRNRL